MAEKTIRLDQIVIDPNIQVREVEGHTVSKYAQAMRAGSTFPPLVVEQGTNRLVCGNHRYYGYKRVLEPSDEVPCVYRAFESEADIIREAARDNATHGRPLDTWDQKRIAIKLREYGDSAEDISGLLGIPVKRVQGWAGQNVIVIPGRKKSTFKAQGPITMPVKHGLEHKAGQKISEKVYGSHMRHDLGVPVKNMAAIITRHINDGLIDTEDQKTIQNLNELYSALGGFLIKHTEEVMA